MLRAKLTPDYPLGCKRILISNEYYETLARPNVDVVTDNIAEVTPTGIRPKTAKIILLMPLFTVQVFKRQTF